MVNANYLYDETYFSDSLKIKHFSEKKLGFRKIEKATILPYKNVNSMLGGGVVDENSVFLKDTSIHTEGGIGYSFSPENVVKKSGGAIYLGLFCSCWGHCLTDNIRRCWFFKNMEFIEEFRNFDLVYVPANDDFSDNFKKMLSIIGVEFDQLIPITQLTQYETLVIPDESFYTLDGGTRYFTKEYVDTINLIRAYADRNFSKIDYDKVYFTYSKYAKRKPNNEAVLEQFFKEHGFTIIAPEEYTFEEQLNILANCSVFASTIGSCAHNMIFLPENATAILIPRAWYLTAYQCALNDVVDVNVVLVDSSVSAFANREQPWMGPFSYIVSENLLRYFNDNRINDNNFWKTNLAGIRSIFRNGLLTKNVEVRIPPEYYYREFLRMYQKYIEVNTLYRYWLKIERRVDLLLCK